MTSISPLFAFSVRLVQYCSINLRRFFLGLSLESALSAVSSFFSGLTPRLPRILLKIGIAGAVPKSNVSSFKAASSKSSSRFIKSINCSLICSISSSEIFIFLSISSTGFMPSSFAQTRHKPFGSASGLDISERKTTAGRFLHFEQSFIF